MPLLCFFCACSDSPTGPEVASDPFNDSYFEVPFPCSEPGSESVGGGNPFDGGFGLGALGALGALAGLNKPYWSRPSSTSRLALFCARKSLD